MKTFFTVHAIARNEEGKVLILRRARGRDSAGKWNCVTGFAQERESANEAALRELKEETGLVGRLVRVGEPYWKDIKDKRWVIVPSLIDVSNDNIALDKMEHSEFRWVNPGDRILEQTIAVVDSLRALGLRN